ncbi:MAG: hypothetical protein HYV75_04145 [Opitutae bacterium]|nr:hypothetical protein [Opitutae bacterium]
MNFHLLLQHRAALLRQARLANLAFAHQRLGNLAARIARARLRGRVRLDPGDPEAERPWPALTALEGSQAVLEEHFLDEDGVELADILEFLGKDVNADGVTFRLEEVESRFLAPLRRELESAGVVLPADASQIEDSHRGCG